MSAPTPEPTSAPTLDQIRDAWVHDRDGVSHRPWGEQPTQAWSRRRSEFDRALAAHDARVRAEALREAERAIRSMAKAWGGGQVWITTGTKVADVAGDVLAQLVDEEASRA